MKTKKLLKMQTEESSDAESAANEEDTSMDDESDEDQASDNEEEQESENDEGIDASDNEEEEASDQEDLAASDTESDDDDEEDVSDEENTEALSVPTVSREERIKLELLQKYQELKGKQLYIRFPHKIPEDEDELMKSLQNISPLIVKAHKPRQRHARFCLVDFASNDERDSTLKKIQKRIQKGELAKYVVNIPKTESDDFVNELAAKRIQSFENKKAKQKLKKASKNGKMKKFSPTLIITNLPKTASALQIRELFPTAVDVQVKANKGSISRSNIYCSVTLPSTMEARNMTKLKLSLAGIPLNMKFDSQLPKKKNKKSKNPKKSQVPAVVLENNESSKVKTAAVSEKIDKSNKTLPKGSKNKKKTNNIKKNKISNK